MAEEKNGLVTIHEQLQKLNAAMFEEDGKVERLKEKVNVLEKSVEWQEKQMVLFGKSLDDILENTKWVKRAILTAIISTVTAGILGGTIALIWTTVGK